MDSQAGRFKDAIVEVLLKRIIPLEKQLEAQTEVIDQLTQSLESITKMLSLNQPQIPKISSGKPQPKSAVNKYEEQKLKEQRKKEEDILAIKKAFVLGISKLKVKEGSEDQKESRAAGEPESEEEEEIPREDELEIIDIELSQLADFKDDHLPTEYVYPDLSLGAIAALAELDEASLLVEQRPPPKVRWVLCLFWQIQGKLLTETEAWTDWVAFVREHSGTLEEAFYRLRSSLDFTMPNLNRLESLLKRRKNLLNPALFNYSPAASHLMAIVRNIIEFSGVVSAASGMRYQRLLYKKDQ